MPILDIEIIGEASPAASPSLAQDLADEAGRVFGARPGTTWVRLRTLAPGHYAENGAVIEPFDRPVFVTVQKRELPARTQLTEEIAALTQAVARSVGRPAEHVHVKYEPAAAGRQAFGGTLLE